MNHLLTLLEEEDSAYISVEDLISEIHSLIGLEHSQVKVIDVLLVILRKEKKDFDVYIKESQNGWAIDRGYGTGLQTELDNRNSLHFRKQIQESMDDDLPF